MTARQKARPQLTRPRTTPQAPAGAAEQAALRDIKAALADLARDQRALLEVVSDMQVEQNDARAAQKALADDTRHILGCLKAEGRNTITGTDEQRSMLRYIYALLAGTLLENRHPGQAVYEDKAELAAELHGIGIRLQPKTLGKEPWRDDVRRALVVLRGQYGHAPD